MVLRTSALGGARDATGIELEFPVAAQLSAIRASLPERTRVAVLFNPAENAERVKEAVSAATRIGLRLVPIEVRNPSGLPTALERVAREADVLWGLTDSVVLSPESAKGLLLFSFRNRIPLVGVSGNWVRAGALLGLERDYEDLGRQLAEMAVAILGGTEPRRIPATSPRKACAVVNVRTARQLDLELPEDVVRGACETLQ
jgi:putative ABC transport system substrate-binding protein